MTKNKQTYPETPELDKQSAVIHSGAAGAVQEFYDWLTEQGYVLAKYRETSVEQCSGIRRDPFDPSNCKDGTVIKTISRLEWSGSSRTRVLLVDMGQECPKCGGTGEVTVHYTEPPLEPVFINPEQLMADHFGIDRDKIEAERRAILDMLRESA